MYFKSTLDFGDEVHYELRSKDTTGIYVTISEFAAAAQRIYDAGYDGLAELATDMHVMNIPVTVDRIVEQVVWWKLLEPTLVRLDASYRDVV